MREAIAVAKRIVVKVGTSTLTYENGRLNLERIEKLVRQIADLSNQGKEVILVSSGAVGAGLPLLGLTERPKDISVKQAAAAVGQGLLLQIYEKLFREYGIIVGQVLLTRADSVMKSRYINLKNTLSSLLQLRAIPIINENDVVAVDELKIGDNDSLSAMVASIVEADVLIILSDIDGLYTSNPNTNKSAELIPVVDEITPAVFALASGSSSTLGTGGMITKIEAATIAVNSGVNMVIASGSYDNIIREIIRGHEIGTWFVAKDNKPHMKKRWLAFGAKQRGKIYVDKGCAEAIVYQGSSLLAVGITSYEGQFKPGDAVEIYYGDEEIGRGLINYDASDLAKIKGAKISEISEILDRNIEFDEVIHRDDLVVFR